MRHAHRDHLLTTVNLEWAIKSLDRGGNIHLVKAFIWSVTPHGVEYWENFALGKFPLTVNAREYIKELIIDVEKGDP